MAKAPTRLQDMKNIGAMEDRHWLEVQRDRRTEILLRLDDRGMAPQ